jgi:hypothetical protein
LVHFFLSNRNLDKNFKNRIFIFFIFLKFRKIKGNPSKQIEDSTKESKLTNQITKMENNFDKTKFVVNFDSVLTNKKMGKAFYKFLQSELNSESFDFLMEVKNLETTKDEKQQIEQSKSILTTYFVPNTKIINISGELREKTLSKFGKQISISDKWVLEKKPEEIFEECFHVIKNILQHDPFKRFIRTEECEKIMKIYKNHFSVLSPRINKTFVYKMADFKNPYIDDRDFDFFKALMEDDYNWKVLKYSINRIKLIGSKASEQMNAFISNTKYIEDSNISKTITVTKCETILHCTMDQALLSYYSNEMLMNSEPNCARFRTTNYIEYEDLVNIYKENKKSSQISKYKRDLCFSALDFSLPFPFNPRSSNRTDSCYYDAKTKSFFMVGKNYLQEGEDEFCTPINIELCKKRNSEPKPMKAYRFFMYTARMYQQIDEKKILFKDVGMLDFGGWASSKPLTKFIIEDRKNKYKESIIKMAKLIPEDKKISDYVEKLTKKVDGKVVDGFAYLLANTYYEEEKIVKNDVEIE